MLTYLQIVHRLSTLPVPPPARQQETRWRFRASIYCAILAVGVSQRKLTAFTGLPTDEIEPILDSLYSNDLLLTGALSERYVKQFLRAGDAIVDEIVGRGPQTDSPVAITLAPTNNYPRRKGKETITAIITRLVMEQPGFFDVAAIRTPYRAITDAEHKTATATVVYAVQQLLRQGKIKSVEKRSKIKGGMLYEVAARKAV